MTEQDRVQERVLEKLGVAGKSHAHPEPDQPTVVITVEGRVGSAKTALVNIINQALLEHGVDVQILDDYTQSEIKVHAGADDRQEILLYNPRVLLRERLNIPRPR
jgi:adenylylsulfate kinase-like enzyme